MSNSLLVMIAGESTGGKSASLMNLRNPEGVFYLNTEAMKPLPFPDKFKKLLSGLNNPNDIFALFQKVEQMDDIHTIVIDSLTFLMEMFESMNVLTASNTMRAWSDYGQFFKRLMQEVIAKSNKNWIILAHNTAELKEDGTYRYFIPVKGALAKTGIEAYFSIVVYARKAPIKELEELEYDPELLRITDRDRAVGYKHVFQVDITRKYADSRIRAPMGCWQPNQLYMDNNAQMLIDHLTQFYGYEPKN